MISNKKYNSKADNKKVIWSVCEEMLREGKERKDITGRKVAARKTLLRSLVRNDTPCWVVGICNTELHWGHQFLSK